MVQIRATRCSRFAPLAVAALVLGLGLGVPRPSAAFCGFYVGGADAALYNDATMVVMMRDGERTVLAMQNNYQGPPEDFALVVPVPVVLRERNVRVLTHEVFEHVDKLAAPRLVEYWERDPCEARERERERYRDDKKDDKKADKKEEGGRARHGVTVEAEFVVGEYEVAILSARNSTGLDTWLREENYNIPEGAAPVLQPYVEGGMKFFVARVDVSKVKFEPGPDGVSRAKLSPLRFHYDSKDFSLPVRLGLINARGPQDLLIHILAPNQRYEVANYPNVTIPTNLAVKDETRERFGEFYVSLFDHTLAQNPGAVVTEYAWAASSCDPCPTPGLSRATLISLGADVLPRYAKSFDKRGRLKLNSDAKWQIPRDFTLTRLHARYDESSLREDLVFREAEGISGGRGMPENGKLGTELELGGVGSTFQARYAILHYWDGPTACRQPLYDQWGGPPRGGPRAEPTVARELAFVARDTSLRSYVTRSAHEALKLPGEAPADERPARARAKGCACASAEQPVPLGALAAGLGALSLLGLPRRRRRRCRAQAQSGAQP